MIPSTAPTNTQAIGQNSPNGSFVFMGLSVSNDPYLVALGVGSDPANIVSTVFIPATGGNPASPISANSQIAVTMIGSTSVSFQYATPPGQMPLANNDWVGLWQGFPESALYTVPPTWAAQMGTNNNQGNWGINLPSGNIQRGTMYTLGYFKGGYSATGSKQTTLACSATFSG